MTRQSRLPSLSTIFLVLVILVCLSWTWQLNRQTEELSYSEMVQLFQQEKVSAFSFSDGHTVTLTLRDRPEGRGEVRCKVYDFQLFYDDLNDLVRAQKAKGVLTGYSYPPPETTNWLELLLPWIMMALVLGGGDIVVILGDLLRHMGEDAALHLAVQFHQSVRDACQVLRRQHYANPKASASGSLPPMALACSSVSPYHLARYSASPIAPMATS